MEVVELSLHHLVRQPVYTVFKPPVLIMLHGYGGNEDELYGLASNFDERFLVIGVRAPFSLTSKSFLWYQIERKKEGSLINSVEEDYSRKAIVNFIGEAVQTYDADPGQVYLLGFDQGAVVSLSAMLTNPDILAGVIAISGELPNEIRPLSLPPKSLKDFPVFLAHGLQDEIVPISSRRSVRDYLLTNQVNLTYHEYTSGHFVLYDSLNDFQKWLTALLNIKTTGILKPISANVPTGAVKIGHVQLKVRDLDRSITFFQRFLGLNLVERTGSAYAFLASQGNHHHILALQKVGEAAPTPPIDGTGLFHVAFAVSDKVTFAKMYKNLVEGRMRVNTTDHIICWSMYFTDPDGNGIEVYWDTRDIPGKSHLWQGRDLPLTPETIYEVLTPSSS